MPRGAAARRRKAAAAKRRMASPARTILDLLPPDLLADIHDRLGFADRIAFLSVFGAFCGGAIQPAAAPWLVLPAETSVTSNPKIISLADRCTAVARALRDQVFLGSSGRWLALADANGQLYVVNRVTGEQKALPDITTMGVFLPSTKYRSFNFVMRSFMDQYAGSPPPDHLGQKGCRPTELTAHQMRHWFYRKVVLSASPRPAAAMLVLYRELGAPVFATAEDGAWSDWSLAPSVDGVEDAIHHNGQFYSITYAGDVEAWERDEATGKFTSTVVAPRLVVEFDNAVASIRKYLAAAPDGRLMVVLKRVNINYITGDEPYLYDRGRWWCSFKVHILGGGGQYWTETKDIGEAALFVSVNGSLCVPTRGNPELEAGHVYYSDHEVEDAWLRRGGRHDVIDVHDLGDAGTWPVRAYSLKAGKMEIMKALELRSFWPPPAWFPSEST